MCMSSSLYPIKTYKLKIRKDNEPFETNFLERGDKLIYILHDPITKSIIYANNNSHQIKVEDIDICAE